VTCLYFMIVTLSSVGSVLYFYSLSLLFSYFFVGLIISLLIFFIFIITHSFGDITPFNAMRLTLCCIARGTFTISSSSSCSRMFITSYIILGIVLLPQLINELITSVAEKKRIYKEYESGVRPLFSPFSSFLHFFPFHYVCVAYK
jgi:archaellum biogenesis protein FlaJ (TadC family)